MKTKEEILKRIQWLEKAINDDDNDTTAMQIKLYAQLDILRWMIED